MIDAKVESAKAIQNPAPHHMMNNVKTLAIVIKRWVTVFLPLPKNKALRAQTAPTNVREMLLVLLVSVLVLFWSARLRLHVVFPFNVIR